MWQTNTILSSAVPAADTADPAAAACSNNQTWDLHQPSLAHEKLFFPRCFTMFNIKVQKSSRYGEPILPAETACHARFLQRFSNIAVSQ